MLLRQSARARAGRPRAPLRLHLEQLEPLLFLSADPLLGSHEWWAQQQVFLGSINVAAAGPSAWEVSSLGTAGWNMIRAPEARSQYGYTGSGYTVAVIDTGVDYTHPAFQGRYVGGWDFVANDADPMDENGHGTHVAGIIAANHSSLVGVAPGANIAALRVLDASGSGSFSNVQRALQWVIEHQQQYNIVAVNLSLGSGNYASNPFTFLSGELRALKDLGVFVAAASGNSFYAYGSQQGLSFPAVSSLTVSVGAVWDGAYGSVSWSSGAQDYSTAADRVTSFTQRSSALNLLAPGAFIYSTYVGGGFVNMAGTSMATPFVAGAAVLVHQALDATGRAYLAHQDYILSVLQSTGVVVVDGDDEQDNVINTGLSFRRIDVWAALASVGSGSGQNPALTGDQAFVVSLYQTLLGRDPDAAGLSYWSFRLGQGLSRGQLAHVIWNSTEHRSLQVAEAYTTVLGRQPAAAERSYWVSAMQAGLDERGLWRAFLCSAEYSARYATNSEFVQSLYQNLLGRGADASGLVHWTSQLASGMPRSQLVETLMNTTERYTFLVRQLYHRFLNRSAAANEVAYWLEQLQQQRADYRQVACGFLASPEFYARAVSAAQVTSLLATGTAGAAALHALAGTAWAAMPQAATQALFSQPAAAAVPPAASQHTLGDLPHAARSADDAPSPAEAVGNAAVLGAAGGACDSSLAGSSLFGAGAGADGLDPWHDAEAASDAQGAAADDALEMETAAVLF